MIPFICRAKKIDSDELVEGFYTSKKDGSKHFIRWDGYMEEIKPETLEISFDGGESFRSVGAINQKLNDVFVCSMNSNHGVTTKRQIKAEFDYCKGLNNELEN